MPYQYDSNDQKNNAFDEYLDSLEDENQKEEPTLSPQVEEDLLQFKKSTKPFGNAKKHITIIAIVVALVAVLAATFPFLSRRSHESYDTEIWTEVDDEIEEETYEDRDVLYDPKNLAIPLFELDDKIVRLPIQANELLEDNYYFLPYQIDDVDMTVGSEPKKFLITTDYHYTIAEITVISPTGEEVPVSESTVIGGTFSSQHSWTYFPSLSFYSDEERIETQLDVAGVDWTKDEFEDGARYQFSTEYENETGRNTYDVKLLLHNEELYQINIQLNE